MADVTSIAVSVTRGQVQRITIGLFIAQALYAGTVIGNITVTSIAAVQISGLELLAGVPAFLGLIGRAGFAFPLGWFTDVVGRRRGLTIGFVVSALSALVGVLGLIQESLPLFLLATFLMGIGRATQDQGRYVAAEVSPPDRRAKAIGFVVFAGTIGAIIGPPLIEPSNLLAQSIGLTGLAGPLLVSFGLTILASATLFVMLRPEPSTVGRRILRDAGIDTDEPPETTLERARRLIKNPKVRLALTAMLTGQAIMVMLMTIMPLHMFHNDFDTIGVSWVVMAHTLGIFGPSNFTGWLIDRFGRLPMIAVGGLILTCSAVLAPTSASLPVLLGSMFLLGAGWNFCYIAGSSLFADSLGSTGRGRSQGMAEAVSSSASGGASLMTGLLFAVGGFEIIALIGLSLSIALTLLVVWIGWRSRPGAGIPVPISNTSPPRSP